jgi:hypothetical protein
VKVIKAAFGGLGIVFGFFGLIVALLGAILGILWLVFWALSLLFSPTSFVIGLFVLVGGGWLAYTIYTVVKVSKNVYKYDFKTAWRMFLNDHS